MLSTHVSYSRKQEATNKNNPYSKKHARIAQAQKKVTRIWERRTIGREDNSHNKNCCPHQKSEDTKDLVKWWIFATRRLCQVPSQASMKNTITISRMDLRDIRWNSRQPIRIYLFLSAIMSLCITLVAARSLNRAPWLDEVMLFSNYPLGSILESLRPLKLYDQAATPIYSILYGWTASLATPTIRGIQFFTLLSTIIVILGWNERSLISLIVAALVATSLPVSLQYLIEMKHYGLEAVGALGIISWIKNSSFQKPLRGRDALFLILFTTLGLSTLPLVAIAMITRMATRVGSKSPITRKEVLPTMILLAALILYYAALKSIAVFQLSNYPIAYSYPGFLNSASIFIKALTDLLPGPIGIGALLVSFIILLASSRETPEHRRLCGFAIISLIAIALLTAFNLYPAKYPRHVFWASAFIWTLTYEAIISIKEFTNYVGSHKDVSISTANMKIETQGGSLKPLWAVLASLLLVLIGLSSFQNVTSLAFGNTENDTYQAIKHIRMNPDIDIGVYGGAQSVISYYSKQYADLQRRKIFGNMNPNSAIALPKGFIESDYIRVDISRVGAWARFWQKKADKDKALEEVLLKAPPRREFLFFTYWIGSADNKYSFSKEQRKLIYQLNCKINEENDFGSAKIYKMICSG
jgi:hypothetical protein